MNVKAFERLKKNSNFNMEDNKYKSKAQYYKVEWKPTVNSGRKKEGVYFTYDELKY